MTPKQSVQLIDELGKLLNEADGDFLRKSVEKLYNMLMTLEVEQKIGAANYERSANRNNSRNGVRSRSLQTTSGEITLDIPKLRQGSYMPSFVEPRRMTDKALVSIIQDAYINGVSTRKVDKLVEGLGIHIDKSKVSRLCKEIDNIVEEFRNRNLDKHEYPYIWLDATFPKVREGGRICSMAMAIAIGVSQNGDREVLGFEIGMSESGEFWDSFIQTLIQRGLKGVKLVISDSHPGLKKAVSKNFTGVAWQRCQVHFMRNVVSQVPKKQKGMVAAIVRTIFNQDSKEEAKHCLRMVVDQLINSFPKAAEVVELAEDEVLAYMNFPKTLETVIW